MHVAAAYAAVEDALSRVGLSLSRSKTKIWTLSESVILPPPFQECRVAVLERLGACLVDEARPSDPALPSMGGVVAWSLDTAASRASTYAMRLEDLCKEGLSIQVAQALF